MRQDSILSFALTASIFAVIGCSVRGATPEEPRPILQGLADYHSHQFGYLGMGGTILSHSVDPKGPCLPVPGFDESTLRMEDLVRHGLFAEAQAQATTSGQCSPTLTNLASQRVDTDNLERAWRYGLRLMVMHTVNSEFLCKVARLTGTQSCPTDQEAIELQIQAAKDLEAKIDSAAGGPDSGWYRIVVSPEQARRVITDGKLAVVIGVEASNAFGCMIASRTTVNGVPNLLGTVPQETAWQLSCGLSAPGLESLQTQKALALFERYWQLGARHFYPIHNIDGTAGGTALSIPLLHAEHNPSRQANSEWFNRVPDIDRTIRDIRLPVMSWDCSSRFAFDGGRCNARGLTESGRFLIRMMASHGAVIDIDHTSWRSRRELLSDDGLLGGVYPFVSSHGGMLELHDSTSNNGVGNNGDKNSEGQLAVEDLNAIIRAGGAIAPVLPLGTSIGQMDTYPPGDTVAPHRCGGTSESFVQVYRYVVDKLKSGTLLSGKPAFVGVGIGSDFGAPVPIAVAPRFFPVDMHIVAENVGTGFKPSIVAGFRTIATGGPLAGPGGYCYPLSVVSPDSNSKRHVSYPFASPLNPDASFGKSTTSWSRRTLPHDVSFDGVIHIGMIPDFVEELRALRLTDDDLKPLWHGAEAYIRAWESSVAWRGNFVTEDNAGIEAECRALRAELLKHDDGGSLGENVITTTTRWRSALEQIRQKECHGAVP